MSRDGVGTRTRPSHLERRVLLLNEGRRHRGAPPRSARTSAERGPDAPQVGHAGLSAALERVEKVLTAPVASVRLGSVAQSHDRHLDTAQSAGNGAIRHKLNAANMLGGDFLSMAFVKVVEATDGRSGKRFEPVQELEIHAGAIAAAATLPGASAGVLLIAEMRGPIGIPDFTAIVGGQKAIAARLSSRIAPILSPSDASLLASLYIKRTRTVAQLSEQLLISDETTALRLRNLKNAGAVIETTPRKYTRHPALSPAGSVYAIEAKVKDWRKAVQQSRRYRVWSNNYVVALGALSDGARTSASEEVASDCAGLIVDGVWVRKPKPRPVSTQHKMLAFEHIAHSLI
ncbi:hypothetical protein CMsap09_02535 [Clavibacter michiganensis]|uniref:Uncharacterized protein n=1 Tax=Clavibacter michiganensis TaxID=28447 RepID=A0A251XRN0_9MICO|nr:hypothetical protein CMsap09_02535 [Clavibacter michiganensis]